MQNCARHQTTYICCFSTHIGGLDQNYIFKWMAKVMAKLHFWGGFTRFTGPIRWYRHLHNIHVVNKLIKLRQSLPEGWSQNRLVGPHRHWPKEIIIDIIVLKLHTFWSIVPLRGFKIFHIMIVNCNAFKTFVIAKTILLEFKKKSVLTWKDYCLLPLWAWWEWRECRTLPMFGERI